MIQISQKIVIELIIKFNILRYIKFQVDCKYIDFGVKRIIYFILRSKKKNFYLFFDKNSLSINVFVVLLF